MSRNQNDKKRGAVISAVVIISILAVFVGFILFPLISEMGGVFFAVILLMLYIAGILAVIFGVIAALKERLEEIENGEEEEAKKY